MNTRIAWTLALVLAVVATTRFADPVRDRALVEEAAGDSYSYLAIAEAAPGFPRDTTAFHYAQRFAIPYAIGIVHRAIPVGTHDLFRLAVVLFELAILLVVGSALETAAIRGRDATLVLAVLALNPWVFRQYVAFPEMVNDLGFVLGLVIMIRALLAGRTGGVLVGQLIASVSRQTGLLLVPVVAVWVWRDVARWGQRDARARMHTALSAAVIAVLVYLATARIAAMFAGPSENAQHLLGVFTWIVNDFDAREGAAMLVRMLAVVAVPIVCVIAASMRGTRARDGAYSRRLLLFAAACCWVQPVLAGPAITGGNGERLIGLGLAPLVLGAALWLRDAGVAWRTREFVAVLALLALGSMHHVYTNPAIALVGARTTFGALYAAVCAGIFALMFLGQLRVPAASTSSVPSP